MKTHVLKNLQTRMTFLTLGVLSSLSVSAHEVPASITGLEEAQKLVSAGNPRAAIDIYWQYVSENPRDLKARLALAKAYEAAGFHEHAVKTREGLIDGRNGAFRDVLGHTRAGPLIASKPLEGVRFYWRAGMGWDQNPLRMPSDYHSAYLQTFGVPASSTPVNQQSKSSAVINLGLGTSAGYRLGNDSSLYANGDIGLSAFSSQASARNQSLNLNVGYALHDSINQLRVGPRISVSRFPEGAVSRVDAIGLGIDYSRKLTSDTWISAGLGLDKIGYANASSADFGRFGAYLAFTKAWASAMRPHVQIAVSSSNDARNNDTLTNTGQVTGPDRHEYGLTLSGQIRPSTDWTLQASIAYARGADDSPNWSSQLVGYPESDRWSVQVGSQYRLNDQCSANVRLGTQRVKSQAAFNAYNRSEVLLGASCWIN